MKDILTPSPFTSLLSLPHLSTQFFYQPHAVLNLTNPILRQKAGQGDFRYVLLEKDVIPFILSFEDGYPFFLPDLDQSEDMLIDEIVKVIFKTWIIMHYYT